MNMPTTQNPAEWIDIVVDRVQSLRFGTVELVVHQGRVTQIEMTERIRLEPSGAQKSFSQSKPDHWNGSNTRNQTNPQ